MDAQLVGRLLHRQSSRAANDITLYFNQQVKDF
jgi:hypothetical protein